MKGICAALVLFASAAFAAPDVVMVQISTTSARTLAAIGVYEGAPPDAWIARAVEGAIEKRKAEIEAVMLERARQRYVDALTFEQKVQFMKSNVLPTPYPTSTALPPPATPSQRPTASPEPSPRPGVEPPGKPAT